MKSPEIPNLPISHMFNGDIWLELQALVAPRIRKILQSVFFGVRNILLRDLMGLVTKMATKMLADPATFLGVSQNPLISRF